MSVTCEKHKITPPEGQYCYKCLGEKVSTKHKMVDSKTHEKLVKEIGFEIGRALARLEKDLEKLIKKSNVTKVITKRESNNFKITIKVEKI